MVLNILTISVTLLKYFTTKSLFSNYSNGLHFQKFGVLHIKVVNKLCTYHYKALGYLQQGAIGARPMMKRNKTRRTKITPDTE